MLTEDGHYVSYLLFFGMLIGEKIIVRILKCYNYACKIIWQLYDAFRFADILKIIIKIFRQLFVTKMFQL